MPFSRIDNKSNNNDGIQLLQMPRYSRRISSRGRLRTRGAALLKQLRIDDNLYSNIDIDSSDGSVRKLRHRSSPFSYVSNKSQNSQINVRRRNLRSENSTIESDPKRNEDDLSMFVIDTKSESVVDKTVSDLKPINNHENFTTAWKLPHNLEVANSLNPNIKFTYEQGSYLDIDCASPIFSSLKIRYNPLTFLNFNRLAGTNLRIAAPHDEIQYMHKGRNRNTTFQEILYRSIYPLKKDFVVSDTKPTEQDWYFYNQLRTDSESARFINSNIELTFTQELNSLTQISSPQNTKTSRVKSININGYEIKSLNPSPYPEYINSNTIIHICEHCLSYFSSRYKFFRHQQKCTSVLNPPGTLIYKDESLKMFEIDGRENPKYCRNICLLSMLFLKSKMLFYEVDSFVFYVLYCNNELIGYFSKEKLNSTGYNLSCILTLPIYRRQGFGNLLLDFSYLLSRREFKLGTPEKPLSDLGLLSYRKYWKCKIAEVLVSLRNKLNFTKENIINISLEELGNLTGMITTDVVLGLEQLGVLFSNDTNEKFSIIVKDWSSIVAINDNWQKKQIWKIKTGNLIWKPMIFGPSCGINAVNNNAIEISIENVNSTALNIQQPTVDFFNKHIGLLVNFMSDDIKDSKDMEISSFDNIKERLKNTVITNNKKSEKWHLCFKNPMPPSFYKAWKRNQLNSGTAQADIVADTANDSIDTPLEELIEHDDSEDIDYTQKDDDADSDGNVAEEEEEEEEEQYDDDDDDDENEDQDDVGSGTSSSDIELDSDDDEEDDIDDDVI